MQILTAIGALVVLSPLLFLAYLMFRDRKMIFLTGFRNLVQARHRTLLLGSALGFVTVLLVLLLALFQGITDNMVKAATTLAAGHVNVGAWFKQTPSDAIPVLLNASAIRKIVQENTPGLDYVVDRQRGFGKLISDTSTVMTGFTGIDPAQEAHLSKTLTLALRSTYDAKASPDDQSRPGDLSKLGKRGTIVVFASQAKKLNILVGDAVTLTPFARGQANSATVTVVAICEDIGVMSSFSTFMSMDTIRDLYQFDPGATGVIMIYLKDIAKSDEVMDHLRDVFQAKGYTLMDHDSNAFFAKFQTVMQEDWTGQKLDLSTWEDEVSFLVKIIVGIKYISTALIIVLLFVIVVGVFNTMWIAVRERTSEIGTLRAVGMTQQRVLVMFLTESILLGLGATIAGSLATGLIGWLLNVANIRGASIAFRVILLSDRLHFVFEPSQFLIAIGALTLVTALAALWPSAHAARMQPVTAIQQVE